MNRKIVIAKPHAGQSTVVAKTSYEGSVIVRAMSRAGRNPHLKGHVQEILVQDMRNARNLIQLNGATTQLTKSTTAGTVDIVTVKGGRVIERIQVKDVTSQSGINKLVKQCAEGKYRSARLVGSEETADAFNKAAQKAGISKRMTSSGVSTKTTESLAQRAGATGSGTLWSAVGDAAWSGGAAGALVGGGWSAIKSGIDLLEGRKELHEVAGEVAKSTAKGGIVGSSSGAAASLAGAGTATLISTVGLTGTAATAFTIGLPITAAIGVGYLAAKLFDGIFD